MIFTINKDYRLMTTQEKIFQKWKIIFYLLNSILIIERIHLCCPFMTFWICNVISLVFFWVCLRTWIWLSSLSCWIFRSLISRVNLYLSTLIHKRGQINFIVFIVPTTYICIKYTIHFITKTWTRNCWNNWWIWPSYGLSLTFECC